MTVLSGDRTVAGVGRRTRSLSVGPRLVAILLPLLVALIPSVTLAHPLGNFSVNRYARIELAPDNIGVLYIVDLAEIPTLQAHNRAGLTPDDPAAVAAYADDQAAALVDNLLLSLDGEAVPLLLDGTEIEFPAGQAGLLTQRLTLRFSTGVAPESGSLTFDDRNFDDRLGWKEIVVQPAGDIRLLESSAPVQDVSNGLRAYPDDLMQAPLRAESVTVAFAESASAPASTSNTQTAIGITAGAEDGFADLVNIPALSPMAILLALLAAFGWGAAHAMSPGHGKTIVGAYLVGARGTSRHAIFLGLTTTITHTAGVFALGLITLFASNYILPETLFPWLSLFSGLSVIAIGLFMVRNHLQSGKAGHAHGHHHGHHHGHGHSGHEHEHAHAHHHAHHHNHDDHHSHSHMPPGADGTPVTWRSLLALGVSGGLLPCPSALVVMLSAVALGRVGFGLLLIVAFSLGLAGVLTAVGIAMVHAGKLVARVPTSGRVLQWLPVGSALFITMAGVGITWQALGGL